MFFKRLMKRKLLFFLVIIFFIIVLVFLGAKIYLLFNFLVGNDTIIRISTDKEYFFFTHNDVEDVEFEATVTTNPFCSAVCASEFIDLENLEVLDWDEFSIKPGKPFKKSYKIIAGKLGRGRDYYRFDLECRSASSFLCHSDNEPSTRNLLVTAEYDLNEEEKEQKESFEKNSTALAEEISLLERDLEILSNAVEELNWTLIIDYNLSVENEFELEKNKLGDLTSKENSFVLINELADISKRAENLKLKVNLLEKNITAVIAGYNSLLTDLKETETGFINITNMTRDEFEIANNTLEEFNIIVEEFLQRDSFENKKTKVEIIKSKTDNLTLTLSGLGNLSLEGVRRVGFEEIHLQNITLRKFEPDFPDIILKCTINNVTEECGKDPDVYPLVFLHGHAVTREAPLEYSLEGFTGLQRELEEKGYLSAGAVTLYTKKDVPYGIWDLHVPLAIKASYYFDLFEEPENYRVVLTKSENIDTYAVRMKEVFDVVRFKTGKDKLNVVAFSMGGLVMRRHMQLFGADGFEKVILIGTPNKGIVGDVATLCPIVGGEKRECDDMLAGSLFMQKLNRDKVSGNIYNIYGTGCDMNNGKGDGIVLEKRAKLEDARNYVINGICRGKFTPLHLDLLDVDRYPEVREIMLEILNEERVS